KCELKSNGDIIVYREGVILSDMYSAGNIVFKHENSLCRGSKLDSGGIIVVKTVGGETGAETMLKATREVRSKKMYAGRICVGKSCMDIFDPIEEVIINKDVLEAYVH